MTANFQLVRTAAEVRAFVGACHAQGKKVALVPTMGALHEGHLSLCEVGRQHAQAVVLTIFVNPLQFGPNEDLARYPRQLEVDCELCRARGVDLVFAPGVEEMYPAGFDTHVEPGAVASRWCGASRPGHFRGVATIVLKLLNMAMADVAVFGEKDYQQLQVLRQMAADLNHPTAVLGAPILREPDGLAMSSRNVYLSGDERLRALAISRALTQAQARVQAGARDAQALGLEIAADIAAAGGRVDYAAVVDAATLEPLAQLDRPARALVAAFFGRTRLLDNRTLFPVA